MIARVSGDFVPAAIFIRHFEHSCCDWLNHTTWYLVSVSTRLCAIGWTVPRGSTQIHCCPVAWNLSQYCFIFEHNTDANMLCRLFDNHKYMYIYLHIHQEYCYLGKQKISLYFSASTYEHLWPSPSNLVNCEKVWLTDIWTNLQTDIYAVHLLCPLNHRQGWVTKINRWQP